MSREIKFRAWDKKENTLTDCDDLGIRLCDGMIYEFWADPPPTKVDSDRYLLEQYTGLKDKTGKEIYEGDIVEIPNNNYGYCDPKEQENIYLVVKWDSVDACYSLNDNCLFEFHKNSMNVIGNIHNNPELLGE